MMLFQGGGYTFNFRRDPRVTTAKLAELSASDWLDVRTRAVFVEFTLYNANVNLYGSVIMLIEFLSTGAPIVTQVCQSGNDERLPSTCNDHRCANHLAGSQGVPTDQLHWPVRNNRHYVPGDSARCYVL